MSNLDIFYSDNYKLDYADYVFSISVDYDADATNKVFITVVHGDRHILNYVVGTVLFVDRGDMSYDEYKYITKEISEGLNNTLEEIQTWIVYEH